MILFCNVDPFCKSFQKLPSNVTSTWNRTRTSMFVRSIRAQHERKINPCKAMYMKRTFLCLSEERFPPAHRWTCSFFCFRVKDETYTSPTFLHQGFQRDEKLRFQMVEASSEIRVVAKKKASSCVDIFVLLFFRSPARIRDERKHHTHKKKNRRRNL